MSLRPTGELLARVMDALRAHHIDEFAFTGGVAVGVWAEPRQTKDIDLCGVLPASEVSRLLALRDGLRAGPGEVPDLVRFRVGEWDVDLFVCKDAYDRACLDRSVPATIDGVDVRVVTPEDLLVHKMIKLRTDRRRILQDVADLRAVIATQGGALDWDYLRRWLPRSEAALLASVAGSDDEDLVKRLLS